MNQNEPTPMEPNLQRLSQLSDVEVGSDSPDVRGWDVTTDNDETIGKVDDLIVDLDRMKATYFLVDLSHATRGAAKPEWGEGHVLVPAERARIEHAERRVHVNVPPGSLGTLPRYTGTAAVEPDLERGRTGGPREGERVITRAEEELRVGKQRVPAGEARISKHIETEHRTQPVTITREDVRIERRPVPDPAAYGTPQLKSEEIRVPITEEEAVVEKRPVVKEELVIGKEVKQETVHVEADVRKERLDVDAPDRSRRTERDRKR